MGLAVGRSSQNLYLFLLVMCGGFGFGVIFGWWRNLWKLDSQTCFPLPWIEVRIVDYVLIDDGLTSWQHSED